MQLIRTYSVTNQNYNITISYLDNSKPIHSDFSIFNNRCVSKTSAIKSINFEYNVLIKHEQTSNVFNYKISIDIISSAALIKEIEKSENNPYMGFFRVFDIKNGRIEIDYIDYSIAHNFTKNISEWFESRDTASSSKPIKLLQKHSSFLPFILQTFFTVIYAYLLCQYLLLSNNTFSLKQLPIFRTIPITIGIFIRELSLKVTREAVYNIDRVSNFSFFSITKGDKSLINESNNNNKKRIKNLGINISLQVFVGIFVSLISK
jgi:hypothetical protein